MFTIWTVILVLIGGVIEGMILKSLIDDSRCKINRIETPMSRIHNGNGVELPY